MNFYKRMTQSTKESPVIAPPTFWEKTVEWSYVRKHLRCEDFAAPLDGDEEKAGDVAIGFENLSWCLIEFKRDRGALKSEREKYPYFIGNVRGVTEEKFEEWRSACETLLFKYATDVPLEEAPHFLVYGEAVAWERQQSVDDHDEDNRPYWKMKLHAQRYWSSWEKDKSKKELFREAVFITDIGNLMSISSDFETFKSYLELLISAKGGEANAAQGGFVLKNVVGTHESGFQVVTTVADFVKLTLGLDLQAQYNQMPEGYGAGSRPQL
jgi:hypothetical protein